jgi:hypothetical protein
VVMPIFTRISAKPRRKKLSLLRIENRRQQREHDRRPEFGIINIADVQAAGLKWVYERCEHGVMGDRLYCYVCNYPDGPHKKVGDGNITCTGREPWVTICMRMDAHGNHYYFIENSLQIKKERSDPGLYYPELLEQKKEDPDPEKKPWFEMVAKMSQEVRFDAAGTFDFGLGRTYPRDFSAYDDPHAAAQLATEFKLHGAQHSYFDLFPQERADWQPPVLHGPADGLDYQQWKYGVGEAKLTVGRESRGKAIVTLNDWAGQAAQFLYRLRPHRFSTTTKTHKMAAWNFTCHRGWTQAVTGIGNYYYRCTLKWTLGVGVVELPERCPSQARSLCAMFSRWPRQDAPIPRDAWSRPEMFRSWSRPQMFFPVETAKPHVGKGMTVCATRRCEACEWVPSRICPERPVEYVCTCKRPTYDYEVPKVKYRHHRHNFGFYGDGHSKSIDNKDQNLGAYDET